MSELLQSQLINIDGKIINITKSAEEYLSNLLKDKNEENLSVRNNSFIQCYWCNNYDDY